MRTQVMHEPAIGTPWLERDPSDGPVERTPLDTFPFKIGRNDVADLCIDSTRVSREHAVITRHAKKFKVRDLGSTNGTFLNGQRIEEATLNDGDQLVVAEVEFTFFSGAAAAPRETATQVIEQAQRPAKDIVADTILAVRRAHEVVTRRGLRTLFQPIFDLAHDAAFGFEGLAISGADETPSARCEQWIGVSECRAADRLRQLFRRMAAESAVELQSGRVLLALAASECGTAVLDHLCQLRELLHADHQLVVQIPDSAVRGTADFREFVTALREARIQIAYDGFASGRAQIAEHKDVAPDFLKLAPSLPHSIRKGQERQRQLQLIVRASHDLGSAVIATGINDDDDLAVCRELGCTLVQGDLFGQPQTSSALAWESSGHSLASATMN